MQIECNRCDFGMQIAAGTLEKFEIPLKFISRSHNLSPKSLEKVIWASQTDLSSSKSQGIEWSSRNKWVLPFLPKGNLSCEDLQHHALHVSNAMQTLPEYTSDTQKKKQWESTLKSTKRLGEWQRLYRYFTVKNFRGIKWTISFIYSEGEYLICIALPVLIRQRTFTLKWTKR